MEKLLSDLLKEKGTRIFCVEPAATAKDAADRMTEQHIGALVGVDGASMVGIVTERDVLNKVVSAGFDPEGTTVYDIMTKDVIVTDPGRTVRQAMQIVTEKRLRHLPVMRDGDLIGMVSGGDLTRAIVAEDEDVIDTLYDYIRSGGYPV